MKINAMKINKFGYAEGLEGVGWGWGGGGGGGGGGAPFPHRADAYDIYLLVILFVNCSGHI